MIHLASSESSRETQKIPTYENRGSVAYGFKGSLPMISGAAFKYQAYFDSKLIAK